MQMGLLTQGHFHTQTQRLIKWQLCYSKDFSDLISTSIWTQPAYLTLNEYARMDKNQYISPPAPPPQKTTTTVHQLAYPS